MTEQKNNANGSAVNEYSYNNVGNLTSINSVTQTYDDSGKILTSGTNSFAYDGRNNRLSITDSTDANKNQTNVWGIDDTLTSVTKKINGTNKTFGYSYSANGLLEKKTVAGVQSNSFIWDTSSFIPLMLSDGEYEYIYGIDRVPVAQVKISDGTVTYLHTDLNGSVNASTNSAGSIAGTVAYSPYGKATTASISKFGYAGDWSDPDTGFTYLRNRWLDTNTSAFLSEDPLVQTTGNSFGYTSGNPLTQIDPLGLFSINPLDWVESQVINPIKKTVDDNFKHFTDSISEISKSVQPVIGNSVSWLVSNSGYISAGLTLAAMAATATGVGAPVGAILAGASLAFGAVALTQEGAKCAGWVEGKSCDPAQLGLALASVATGGTASLFKGFPLVARNLVELNRFSTTATFAGIPATGITDLFYRCTPAYKNRETNQMLDEYEKNRNR